MTGLLYFAPNNTENKRTYRRYNITASKNPSVDVPLSFSLIKVVVLFFSKILNIEKARDILLSMIEEEKKWKRK